MKIQGGTEVLSYEPSSVRRQVGVCIQQISGEMALPRAFQEGKHKKNRL